MILKYGPKFWTASNEAEAQRIANETAFMHNYYSFAADDAPLPQPRLNLPAGWTLLGEPGRELTQVTPGTQESYSEDISQCGVRDLAVPIADSSGGTSRWAPPINWWVGDIQQSAGSQARVWVTPDGSKAYDVTHCSEVSVTAIPPAPETRPPPVIPPTQSGFGVGAIVALTAGGYLLYKMFTTTKAPPLPKVKSTKRSR